MAGPTEFTLESVRQFMLAQDGRVTNHDLVKYFKAWLTHPTEKESARQKFKEYVNTLATIKQENGEKYLMLKKRYYPNFDDEQEDPKGPGSGYAAKSSSPSLLDEVMAGYHSLSTAPTGAVYGNQQSQQHQLPSRRVLPPTPSALPQPYHRPVPHPSSVAASHPHEVIGLPGVIPPHHPSVPQDLGLPQPGGPSSGYYGGQQQRSSYSRNSYNSTGSGSPSSELLPSSASSSSRGVPPPYRPPPPGVAPGGLPYRQPPPSRPSGMMPPPPPPPSDFGLPTGANSNYVGSNNRGSHHHVHHHHLPHSLSPPQTQRPAMQQQPDFSLFVNPMQAVGLPMRQDAPPLPRRMSTSDRSSTSSVQSLPQQQQQQQHRPMQQPPRHSQGSSCQARPQYGHPYGGSQQTQPPPLPPPKAAKEETSPLPPPLPSRNSMSSAASSSHLQSSTSSSPDASEAGNKENSPMSVQDDDEEEKIRIENEKISVKERARTLNRLVSEVDMPRTTAGAAQAAFSTAGESIHPVSGAGGSRKSSASSVKRRNSRAAERRPSSQPRTDDKSDDSSSITTIDQNSKTWMVRSAQGDYHVMMKMLMEDPRLSKVKDFTSGFTALHWAAKHGNSDMVKLLAGNYHVDVNVKTHGGYTPLHLACQFGHQDVFDLLVKAYGADPRIRDNHGKTPRQYMMAQEQAMGLSLSSDTFRQLKDRRRNRRQAAQKTPGGGILRFGSLSVKVKKTTEAFNNYFGERKHSWGSSSSSHHSLDGMMTNAGSVNSLNLDSQKMPPPKLGPIKKRKSKRSVDFGRIKSAPTTPTETSPIKEEGQNRSDESDSEFGFDSQWSTPRI